MKLKKLFAGVLAGAMIVSCMAMPTVADVEFGNGSWDQDSFMDTADTTIDLSTADTVVVHATCSDLGYGWNNGSFYANPTDGAWIQEAYGGSECYGQSWFGTDGTGTDGLILTETGAFDVTISLAGSVGCDFTVGYGTSAAAGVFAVTSVDIYAGSTLLATWDDGTWTAAPSTYDTTLTYEITEDNLTASSYTVTLTNTDGATTTYTNNTYYVSGSSYYIGIDITDIPSDQTVSITSVDFN